MSSRFTLRRAVTALTLGAAAAASLVVTAPAAVGAEPQIKLMRLLDECDKETFDVGLPGLCTVDAGSVTFDRFTADLQRGGSGAWWINNRKESVDAGDSLHVVNQGGILHTFTEVKTFGSGVIPPFNVAVNNAPTAVKPDGNPVGFGDIGASGVAPGSAASTSSRPRAFTSTSASSTPGCAPSSPCADRSAAAPGPLPGATVRPRRSGRPPAGP